MGVKEYTPEPHSFTPLVRHNPLTPAIPCALLQLGFSGIYGDMSLGRKIAQIISVLRENGGDVVQAVERDGVLGLLAALELRSHFDEALSL